MVAYELKGYRKAGRETKPPMHYEGMDQALAMLKYPVGSPLGDVFAGSVLNHVYLVHPEDSGTDQLADLLGRCAPLGWIVVNRRGTEEAMNPNPNPFFDQGMHTYFLSRLDTLEAHTRYTLDLVQ